MLPVPRLPGGILRRSPLPAAGLDPQGTQARRQSPAAPEPGSDAQRRHRVMAMRASSLPRQSGPSTRQILKILAASAALPIGVAGFRLFGPQPTFHEWHGQALGAQASMRLWHA